jgi:hypothetical protein
MYCSAFNAIGSQDQSKSDFIGSALTNGAFHERDHAVQKGFPGAGGDPYNDLIRHHERAPGYSGSITPCFTNDGRRFTGNGRLVY